MANSNNWGEIYKSTWWGDEDWSANSLKIDSAPPGFAGQNLLLGSEELNKAQDGQWIQRLISSVTADDEVAPIGGETTAESVAFTANKQSRIEQLVTLVAGTEYTFSVWAKATGGSPQSFRLSYYDNTAGSGARENETAPTSWDASTGRATMTFTAASSGTYWMRVQNASAGAAQSIYFWGAMLNEGAAAGDYIKTTFAVGPTDPPVANAQFGDNFGRVSAYYSLRQFTTAEDNNAIRVRRSSDDTEQDIGFDANGDLDSTALTTFVNEDVNLFTSDYSSGGVAEPAHTTFTETINETKAGETECLKAVWNGTSPAQLFKQNFLPTEQGVTLDISAQFYLEGFTGVRMGPNGNFGDLNSTTNDWATYTQTITVNNTNDDFTISLNGGTNGSTVWLKNIVVTQTTADGAVTTWYDQSGNGNNATNATESEQPLVVSAGTLVEENSKAAIDFDGVDDDFAISVPITSGFSIFGVYKNTKANSYLIGDSPELGRRSSDEYRFRDSAGFSAGANGGTHSDNQVLIAGLEDGANARVYANGVEQASVASTFSSATLTLIGKNFPDANVQEIIIFNSDQSGNRTGMEGNIDTYFDIT